MSATSSKEYIIVSKRHFPDFSSKSFKFRVKKKMYQGFVVRKGSHFYAYLNLCRHLPVTLDLGDNQFFTHDKKYLQCHMHGATYEIHTGLCVGGPCEGARLGKLEVEEEENRLVIAVPKEI